MSILRAPSTGRRRLQTAPRRRDAVATPSSGWRQADPPIPLSRSGIFFAPHWRLLAPASRGQTGHEKAGGIGRLDHGLGFHDNGVAGNDRYSGQPGRGRAVDGLWTYRGKIETQILSAFRRFHQHAPRRLGANATLAAQTRNA